MSQFKDLQARLEGLIPIPSNLPVIYLLGDTGAGKTCVVRQLLGTTKQSFPSVKRLRTTVAPTEFIITNEPELVAAFVFKGEQEISRFVREILEEAVLVSLRSLDQEDNGTDLVDVLANSPDERFRLSCFLPEKERRRGKSSTSRAPARAGRRDCKTSHQRPPSDRA
jgi:Cdc6-like AAA superfamily ATPase